MADDSRPTMVLQTVAAKVCVVRGSSLMTVFKPMEEMSRNCSLSPTMLLHSVSTMCSTWWSLTLPTRGPKLEQNQDEMYLT